MIIDHGNRDGLLCHAAFVLGPTEPEPMWRHVECTCQHADCRLCVQVLFAHHEAQVLVGKAPRPLGGLVGPPSLAAIFTRVLKTPLRGSALERNLDSTGRGHLQCSDCSKVVSQVDESNSTTETRHKLLQVILSEYVLTVQICTLRAPQGYW